MRKRLSAAERAHNVVWKSAIPQLLTLEPH